MTVLYGFDDGTVQGWVAGWVEPDDSVTLTNVDNRLRTSATTVRARPGSLRMPAHDGGQLDTAADKGAGDFLSAEVTLAADAPAGVFGCNFAWQAQDWSWKERWETGIRRMDTGQAVTFLVPGVPCMVHTDFGLSDPIVNPRGVQVSPGSGWTDLSTTHADVDNVRRTETAPVVEGSGGGGGTIPDDGIVVGWSGPDHHPGIRRDITASWANRESWDDLENAHWFGVSPNGAWHWLNDGNYEKAIFLNIGLIPHNIAPGEWDATGRKERWDGLLDEAASGTRDYVYEGMGARLSDYGSRFVYCVLWWEMNQHDTDVDEAKFKAAWTRAVPLIRSAFAARAAAQGRTTQTLQVVYAPMHSRVRWWDWLPADLSTVDVIGCNVYAKEWFSDPPSYQQIKDVVDGDLERLRAKAVELGKPMALPEWANWSATSGAAAGVATSRGLGDEPDVVDWYADWIVANGAVACYFDIDHGDGVLPLNDAPATKQQLTVRFPEPSTGGATVAFVEQDDVAAIVASHTAPPQPPPPPPPPPPPVVQPPDPNPDNWPADELAKLISSPNVQLLPTCHLLDDDNRTVDDLTPWLDIGGHVERGNYQTVHGQCSIRLARPLNWCRDRIRLGMWVGPVHFPLGVYLVSVPTTVAGRTPKTWQVDGYDLLETVAHPHGSTFVAPAGAGHLSTARSLLESAGLTVLFAGMADDPPLERDRVWPIDPETTTLNIVNGLLESAGWQAVWADQHGTVRSGRYVSPAGRPAGWTYDTSAADSTVGVERKLTRDYFRVPNRWVFIRDDPEAGDPVEGAGIYTVNNVDEGPTSQSARGRTITRVEQRDAASQAALVASGDRTVEADRSIADEVELTVAANPSHWHFDVVRLVDPELGVDRRFVQRRWRLPLDGSDMTIDARGV